MFKVIFCLSLLLYYAIENQCRLYHFTRDEVISAFKSNDSREPVSETLVATSESSSSRFFFCRTTLGTQISISQGGFFRETEQVYMCMYINTHAYTHKYIHI